MSRTLTALSRILRASLVASALLVIAPAQAGQNIEKPDIRMALGWTLIASQLPFIYGVEKGYFKEEGLNVTLDSGAGAGVAIQRVVSGVDQFGYADIGTLIRYNAENRARPLVAVYVAEDDSPLALFTLEKSGINKPKDIEGKRIGVSQFDGARLMLPVLAKANQVELSTVNTSTVEAKLREVMLTRREVDVITGFTSTSVPLLTSLKQKFVVLRYRDFGVEGIGQSVVVSPDFAAQNPNTVRAFVRAVNRSVKGMIERPKEALGILKKANPLVDMQAEELRLNLMLKELILTQNVTRNGLSNVKSKRLDSAIADVLQTTKDGSPLSAESVYTDRFLPPAAERLAPTWQP